MIVKLINYNKKLEADILHAVIIDQIEFDKNNENLMIKIANETGFFELQLKISQNIEDLIFLIKAIEIEIPLNFELDLSKILNKNMQFKYSFNQNNKVLFEFVRCSNQNSSANQSPKFYDENDIPF